MRELLLRSLVRLQRLTLLLYPGEFQRLLGADMRESLESRARAAERADGAFGLLRVAVPDLVWVVAGAPAEWLRHFGGYGPEDRRLAVGWLEDMINDLRQAARSLVTAPGFATTAVVTLALGIGMNVAIFSVIEAVLLRPLPYGQPDRLVAVNVTFQEQSWWSASLADVLEWRELAESLDSVSFALPTGIAVADGSLPEQRVAGARVAANWFETLDVEALHGRTFAPGEDSQAAGRVAVLAHGYWQRRYGGDPTLVGRSVGVDGEETTVVGILPPGYRADFLGRPDLYVPRQFTPEDARDRARIYLAVARLAPDVGLEAAQADLDRVAAVIAERNPDLMAGWGTRLRPLDEAISGSQESLLWSLLGAVSLVLLVACANVSNLLLARGVRRRGELAIRAALGAGRGRLVRQMLVETGLLAVVGGGAGLLLAAWSLPALLRLAPASIPRIDETGLDPVVLGFTLVVSLLTGVVFGLLPALRASRTSSREVLREQGRSGSGSAARTSLYRGLVVAEVGLVVALLIGAALLLQSVRSLQRTDLGFAIDDKLVVPLNRPTEFDYSETVAIADFFAELRDRIATIPGVESVADVTRAPLVSATGQTAHHIVEGREYEPGAEPTGGVEVAGPGYFETMGMERLQGRLLNELDGPDSRPVAVINETMARLYWPDASPIGQRVALGREGAPGIQQFREVVGVVRGVRYGPDRDVRPRIYLVDSQSPAPMSYRDVIVRTSVADPRDLVPAIREAVGAIDPNQPIGPPRTYADALADSLADERLQALLLGLFGLTALTLGVIGVYGVVAYSVSRRAGEMGLRMALGARRSDVIRTVLRGSVSLVGGGILGGVASSLALSRPLAPFLHGVSPTDPVTYASVAGVLLLVALCASLLPALRATKVDPVDSLRAE